MNTFRFVLPLTAALAATLPSQDPPPAPERQLAAAQTFDAVILVQSGASDLVLNEPLLNAIVDEPACFDALRKAAAEPRSVKATLPAPHLAGTFQIHVSIRANTAEQSDAQRDRAIDAVVAHLRTRLDQLLFTQPAEQGRARSAELTGKLEDLLLRRAELQASVDATAAHASDLAQRRAAFDQQMAAARLDFLTQQSAREQVARLRTQYADAREQKRAEVVKLLTEQAAWQQRLDDLTRRRGRQEPDEAARKTVDEINEALRLLTSRLDATNAEAADAQRMLTVVLEQLPAGALDQQRAQARIDALAEAQKQLADMAAAAAKARGESTRREIEGERLAIEISVTKSLLTEVEGRLARLQPVRYELLRGR